MQMHNEYEDVMQDVNGISSYRNLQQFQNADPKRSCT